VDLEVLHAEIIQELRTTFAAVKVRIWLLKVANILVTILIIIEGCLSLLSKQQMQEANKCW
jgi:hypothetical protein